MCHIVIFRNFMLFVLKAKKFKLNNYKKSSYSNYSQTLLIIFRNIDLQRNKSNCVKTHKPLNGISGIAKLAYFLCRNNRPTQLNLQFNIVIYLHHELRSMQIPRVHKINISTYEKEDSLLKFDGSEIFLLEALNLAVQRFCLNHPKQRPYSAHFIIEINVRQCFLLFYGLLFSP